MFVRRKKYVCTSICWTLNSRARIRRWTHWWLGLNRRVWPTIATLPRFLRAAHDRFRVLQTVGERNLDLDVLARLEAGDRLRGVQLRRRAQDHRVDLRQREAVGKVVGDVADPVFRRNLPRLAELAAHDRDDVDAVDQPDGVEVLGAEGAGAGQRDLDRSRHRAFSRIRWPTAVFDAGT